MVLIRMWSDCASLAWVGGAFHLSITTSSGGTRSITQTQSLLCETTATFPKRVKKFTANNSVGLTWQSGTLQYFYPTGSRALGSAL